MENKDTVKILVVIDMQNDFVTGSLGTKEAQEIVPNVIKKVKEYSDANKKIFFTKDTHYENYMETQEGKNLPISHCIYGTKGWDLIPELSKYENSNNVFSKHTFGSPQLAKVLGEKEDIYYANNQQVVIEIIGLCTDVCVVSNALLIKAECMESTILVDASCCAGVTPEKHKAALETMKSCQIKVIGE